MTPGDTALARMPCGPSSFASDLVNAARAAFAAAYGPAPGPPPLWPATDPTLTTTPRRRAIIEGTTAWVQNTALLRFRSRISSHAASVSSRIGNRPTSEPALL